MHTQTNTVTARTSVAVARAAALALVLATYAGLPAIAAAQDPTPKPKGTVDVGVGDVTQGSFKAGEFNGLQKKGALALAGLDIRDGATYVSASAFRWHIRGTDLALARRNVFAQVGVQGAYRFRFSYDGIQRNRSDSYQTPYDGAGSTTLTLPSTWLVPTVAGSNGTNPVSARGLVPAIGDAPYISTVAANNGALVTPTSAQMALVNAAALADVPLFHNVNLATTRNRYDASVNVVMSPQWTFDASFKPEHKDGLRPMGTVTRNVGGDISTVIPVKVDSNNNQVSAGLAFKGKRSFAQAGYYGSFYKNNVNAMSWQNWAAPLKTTNTISSEPSNDFNQFSATAGFNFTPTTKLIASGSYGRATQNDAFLTSTTTLVVPVSSLNGLVVSTAFNAKLTARPAPKLNVSAAYKYDNRDNRTAIHIFQYADAEEAAAANANFPAGLNNPLGVVLAQNANANRPYSKKAKVFNVDADFAMARKQWLKAGYDFEGIDRSCPGAWIDCADAPVTHEHTLRAEWRVSPASAVSARVNYAYSMRRVPNYNENAFLAIVPYANVCPATSVGCVSALAFMTQNGWTGYGPSLGYAATTGNMNLFFPSNNVLTNATYANNNRISELPGMRRYYVSDRNRDKVRTLLTWQASDQVTFQARVDLSKDTYPGAAYGLQDAKGWMGDLDGTYAPTDALSLNVFYTYENQRSNTAGNTYTANSNASTINNGQPGVVGLSGNSCDTYTTLQQRNNNNKLDPCLNWSASMLDKANTVGFGFTHKAEHLELTGNLLVSRARWDNNVSGGNWANNIKNGPGAAPTTIAAYFIAATPLPTVITNSADLRLNARYLLAHGQSLRLAYAFLQMSSSDFAYEGMQFGSLSGQLPTNEQPFNYKVHVIGVSYVVSF